MTLFSHCPICRLFNNLYSTGICLINSPRAGIADGGCGAWKWLALGLGVFPRRVDDTEKALKGTRGRSGNGARGVRAHSLPTGNGPSGAGERRASGFECVRVRVGAARLTARRGSPMTHVVYNPRGVRAGGDLGNGRHVAPSPTVASADANIPLGSIASATSPGATDTGITPQAGSHPGSSQRISPGA